MTWASWWTYRALPALSAWLGPGAHRRWPLSAADAANGEAAARAAAGFLALDEEAIASFAARHARYHAADRTDVWAMSTARHTDFERWVSVDGALPDQGAYLALTLHYGAGMWAHAAFARRHARSRWLYARPSASGDRWSHGLMARRLQSLHATMGHPPLPTGGSVPQILAWWREGGGIMALYDVAADGHRRCVALRTQTLGWVQVPRGLFELASAHRIPVYFYRCLLDDATGQRRVQVQPPVLTSDIDVLVSAAATWWDESLRMDPAAWHFWSGAQRLLCPPPRQGFEEGCAVLTSPGPPRS